MFRFAYPHSGRPPGGGRRDNRMAGCSLSFLRAHSPSAPTAGQLYKRREIQIADESAKFASEPQRSKAAETEHLFYTMFSICVYSFDIQS